MPISNIEFAYLLEEVFQLLRECLHHCPFNQKKHSPTKQHIKRLKQLLDPEFSILLSESGSLFFAALKAAEPCTQIVFNRHIQEANSAKNIYINLLQVSRLTMSIGITTTCTTESFLLLNELIIKEKHITTDLNDVIDTSLYKLQTHVKNYLTQCMASKYE